MPIDVIAGEMPHSLGANSLAAIPAGAIIRTLEALSLRGGPTIMGALSRLSSLRSIRAMVQLGKHRITFPAYDEYWSRYLWASVPYEPDVEQIFRKVGKGKVLLDCGANIGYWSVRAEDFGFEEVIAVEANFKLIPFLRENFRLNGTRGTTLHAAIYNTSGERLFLDRTKAHAEGGIGTKGLPVTSITIADLVGDIAADREIIAKLDIEGAEILAIEGGESIANIVYIFEDFPVHGMRVTQYVLERGMKVFGVAPDGRHNPIETVEQALEFNSKTAGRRAPSNLVACAPHKADQLECDLDKNG